MRIPCAHPSEILKLECVDTLRYESEFAYENLAVMCMDPSLLRSPASCMSGGDYDGDDVIIIALPSIVDSISGNSSYMDHTPEAEFPVLLPPEAGFNPITIGSVIDGAGCHSRDPREDVASALMDCSVQAVSDAKLTGIINVLWLKNADKDLSLHQRFGRHTLELVKLQELSLDSPKTGWSIDVTHLKKYEALMPHWVHPRRLHAHATVAHSFSCLGMPNYINYSIIQSSTRKSAENKTHDGICRQQLIAANK